MIVKHSDSGIEAEVLCKSKSNYGPDLVTLRIRFPRFVAEQFLKHRMFSCNAVSSRAMSVPKMNNWILDHTSEPLFWGAQKKGMQPDQECDNLLKDVEAFGYYLDLDGITPEEAWYEARNFAMAMAQAYWNAGYHQQIPNRLTHAFQMAEYIVTATDFENFFNLRLRDKAAQSEINKLADVMNQAIELSDYTELHEGWHLPYVTEEEKQSLSVKDLRVVSAARCAIISYNNHDTDQLLSVEKANRIYNHLMNDTNPHLSPCEHQARALTSVENIKVTFIKSMAEDVNYPIKSLGYFANLKGWKSQRYLLENQEL